MGFVRLHTQSISLAVELAKRNAFELCPRTVDNTRALSENKLAIRRRY
jgi:hypothetical protein